ncbi:MAG TPA: FKBP-type peptidyl-prolyl cis-trans isomerase [Lysobacter sp.]|nr:FKBP-type peptidyl-prolyl cis-trans isomerase [Lysobacter sp.]
MKGFVRGVAALVLMVAALGAQAQEKKVLNTDRDKVSYMIGMDVGSSLSPIGSQIDMAAFERAVRNGFEGGKPLIDDATAKKTHEALMARLSSQNGQPPGSVSKLPEVSKTDVALLVGADVGRSLKPVKDEIDLPTMMQAVRTTFAKGTLLLTDEEARAIGAAFGERQQARLREETAAAAEKNKTDGAAFLAKNRTQKGVFTTASGLQYMVLRQGAGLRPKPTDKVRVNYEGKLLDGKVFDSSYERGQPAEFSLTQVIAGWSEGVSLMPVGGKYRFWVPADIAYGEQGPPDIGPNATLQFDVELLDIVP